LARADLGLGDDLAVRVDGHMALVAVKAAGVRLVPVAGLGIDHADHPIRGHPLGDHKAAVGPLLDVLADDGGQQLGRLGDLGAELQTTQRPKDPVAIAEQGVDQLLARGRILPVTHRLARGLVVVIAGQRRPDQAGQLR
jgi:hypothetical protein